MDSSSGTTIIIHVEDDTVTIGSDTLGTIVDGDKVLTDGRNIDKVVEYPFMRQILYVCKLGKWNNHSNKIFSADAINPSSSFHVGRLNYSNSNGMIESWHNASCIGFAQHISALECCIRISVTLEKLNKAKKPFYLRMNDISHSKLLRQWTWIGRRKKAPIVLPPETLIHILHHFPRKQLVKRYSRVNSSFFRAANRLSPNVHVIDNDNISFAMEQVFCEDKTFVQTFEALILGKYQNSFREFGIAMNNMTKKNRITAAEYFENMPPAFIRFPEFSINSFPNEVLLKFLRVSKQHFVNCRLYLPLVYASNNHEKLAEEILPNTFPNPSAIQFGPGFTSKKFFNSISARNCDKVEIYLSSHQEEHLTKHDIRNDNHPNGTKDIFLEWIQWKQNLSDSRRHLVLIWWSLALTKAQEMLEDLKHAFETATKPLSYVITFASYEYKHFQNNDGYPREFHLDNDHTRERLSLFKDRRDCFRLWRRTVTSIDSTWLSALIGGKRMEKEVREAARKTGFDEKFYDYDHPYTGFRH